MMWVNLEDITLSDRRQTRKATYLGFHVYETFRTSKPTELEGRVGAIRSRGRGKRDELVMSKGLPLGGGGGMKMF